jgi:hypothetical protein
MLVEALNGVIGSMPSIVTVNEVVADGETVLRE